MTMINESAQHESIAEVEIDPLERLSDRELLLSIARDMATIKALMGQAVEGIAPVLGDAKVKLMLGALRGFFK